MDLQKTFYLLYFLVFVCRKAKTKQYAMYTRREKKTISGLKNGNLLGSVNETRKDAIFCFHERGLKNNCSED